MDVLTRIDGVEFDEAWADKVAVTVGGVPTFVLSRANLIKNKRASGRLQDLADVERLEQGDDESAPDTRCFFFATGLPRRHGIKIRQTDSDGAIRKPEPRSKSPAFHDNRVQGRVVPWVSPDHLERFESRFPSLGQQCPPRVHGAPAPCCRGAGPRAGFAPTPRNGRNLHAAGERGPGW